MDLVNGLAQKNDPLAKFKEQADAIQRLVEAHAIGADGARDALAAANKQLREANGGGGLTTNYASPTAILRGTADAALLNDRQRSPIDKLTDLQRQQLKEAKDQSKKLDDQITLTEKNKNPKPVNF